MTATTATKMMNVAEIRQVVIGNGVFSEKTNYHQPKNLKEVVTKARWVDLHLGGMKMFPTKRERRF